MIVEKEFEVFDNFELALTEVAGGTSVDGKVLDYGAEHQAVVTRHQLEIYVEETAVPDTDKTPTIAFEVKTSDDNSTWGTLLTTKTFAVADLVKGAVLVKTDMPESMEQYIKVVVTNGAASTNDFTGGVIVGSVRPI